MVDRLAGNSVGVHWAGVGLLGFGATLLVVAMFLPWHEMGAEGGGVSLDFMSSYPWGGRVDVPGDEGCTVTGLWWSDKATTKGCSNDTEDAIDEDSDEGDTNGSNSTGIVLTLGFFLLLAGVLMALAGFVAGIASNRPKTALPIVGIIAAMLLIFGAVMHFAGQSMLKKDFDDELDGFASATSELRVGAFLAILGVPCATAGAVMDFASRRMRQPVVAPSGGMALPAGPAGQRPLATGAPGAARPAGGAPAIPAGAKSVRCPRCKTVVALVPGRKPVCAGCGFGR